MHHPSLELLLHRQGMLTYGVTLRNEGRWTARGWTLHPADDVSADQVQYCRSALARILGFDPAHMVVPQQVHGTAIADIGLAPSESASIIADAVVTTVPGVLLCISLADCCGVLLWDQNHTMVAAIHAGWRGTAADIVGRCIEHITTQYGVDPRQMHAWLSPCASAERYVVRHDVASRFPGYVHNTPAGGYLLDIPRAIHDQLLTAGLQPENIAHAGICTIGDKRFHSYRRDGSRSGRMAAFIGIAEGAEPK